MNTPHIKRTHAGIELTAVFSNEMERELLKHTFDAYSHCFNEQLEMQDTMSFDEMASAIEKVYSTKSAQVMAIVSNLKTLATRSLH